MSEESTTETKKPGHLFKKGNNFGTGRVQKIAEIREIDGDAPVDAVKSAMLFEYTADDIRIMLRAQMNKAQRGDTNAAKFIRDGIWGKPKVSTTDKESSFISALMEYAESKTIIDTDNK